MIRDLRLALTIAAGVCLGLHAAWLLEDLRVRWGGAQVVEFE